MFELTVVVCLFYICWRLGDPARGNERTQDRKDPWRKY